MFTLIAGHKVKAASHVQILSSAAAVKCMQAASLSVKLIIKNHIESECDNCLNPCPFTAMYMTYLSTCIAWPKAMSTLLTLQDTEGFGDLLTRH